MRQKLSEVCSPQLPNLSLCVQHLLYWTLTESLPSLISFLFPLFYHPVLTSSRLQIQLQSSFLIEPRLSYATPHRRICEQPYGKYHGATVPIAKRKPNVTELKVSNIKSVSFALTHLMKMKKKGRVKSSAGAPSLFLFKYHHHLSPSFPAVATSLWHARAHTWSPMASCVARMRRPRFASPGIHGRWSSLIGRTGNWWSTRGSLTWSIRALPTPAADSTPATTVGPSPFRW